MLNLPQDFFGEQNVRKSIIRDSVIQIN
jgi:hypothetical protein